MRIRAALDESDFRRLHALFVEYEADLPSQLRHGAVPSVAALKETYRARSRAFLIGAQRLAIGCVGLRELDERTALLLRLYVMPQRRGLGAARALVQAAIEFARNHGYDRLVLDTNKKVLQPAYRLYRSLGFTECEPFATVTYECPTFMELRLRIRVT